VGWRFSPPFLFIGGQNDRPTIFARARDQEFLLVGRRSAMPKSLFFPWIFAVFGVFSGEEISSARPQVFAARVATSVAPSTIVNRPADYPVV
jgi:hypothetical protein